MNKKLIEAIAGRLNLDVEALTKNLASEEEAEIKIPEGKLYSDEDIETLKNNHGKDRYEAGKTAEREVTYKNLSREAGLETIKDPSEFMKAYQAKILKDAKIEPEAKVKELTSDLEKLQAQIQEKEKAFTDLENSHKSEKTKFTVQSKLKVPETLGLSQEEATSLFFMNHEVKDDGVYKNGELMKDHLARPIPVEQAAEMFVADKGWNVETPKGRGGGAKGEGGKTKITTFEEFEKDLEAKGINPNSAEAQAYLQEVAKESPEILD